MMPFPKARKPDIFTREKIMLFSHVKRSLLLWLRNKSRLSQRLLVKYLHSKRNLVSPRSHVISSIFSLPTPITCHSRSCIWQQNPDVEYRTNETFWQKFADSTVWLFRLYKRKLFFVDFFTFVTRIHKFKVLVANIKSTAVFSEMVDISQVLLYPFCQLDDDKRSVFQVVVSVYQWSLFFI